MKLSIITVNYNNRKGLQKTIDSVIPQTCQDFEWIIIDGGSTDGSKELIENYQEFFSYWCSEPDNGIFNAMNKGIAKAMGEYLLFLNSGDYLANNHVVEDVLPYLNEYDFISGDTIFEHVDGTKEIGKSPRHLTAYVIVRYALSHQSTFIRSELLKRRSYREEFRIASDWEQELYELIFNDATYKAIPFVVSVFKEDGISRTNLDMVGQERNIIYKEYFSERLLKAIMGDNEMKEVVNHIEEDSKLYRYSLLGLKIIRKMCKLLS